MKHPSPTTVERRAADGSAALGAPAGSTGTAPEPSPDAGNGAALADIIARTERVAARLLRTATARLSLSAERAAQLARAGSDNPATGAPGEGLSAAEGLVRDAVLAAGSPLALPDLAAARSLAPELEGALVTLGWGCMLGVALPPSSGRASGALMVGEPGRREWVPDDVRALEELVQLLALADGRRAPRVEAELSAAKEAAEEARAVAERANQAKTEFLSRMSHELRTPLNSVIGFANVLRVNRGNRLDEREVSYLDRIITNGRHLLTIVGDLLDLSRVEAGKMPVTIVAVPLAPLVRTTAATFEAELAGRPVALVLELPDEVGRLETDPTRLQQVLFNLIGNAMKFTDGGTITVRVVTDPESARPLRLEVQDTGIGIPLHRQAAIFRAFEQGERGKASSQGGTGLGLAISRSLCQLLGFRLGVHSTPGEGATFTVDFESATGHQSSGDHGAVASEMDDEA